MKNIFKLLVLLLMLFAATTVTVGCGEEEVAPLPAVVIDGNAYEIQSELNTMLETMSLHNYDTEMKQKFVESGQTRLLSISDSAGNKVIVKIYNGTNSSMELGNCKIYEIEIHNTKFKDTSSVSLSNMIDFSYDLDEVTEILGEHSGFTSDETSMTYLWTSEAGTIRIQFETGTNTMMGITITADYTKWG